MTGEAPDDDQRGERLDERAGRPGDDARGCAPERRRAHRRTLRRSSRPGSPTPSSLAWRAARSHAALRAAASAVRAPAPVGRPAARTCSCDRLGAGEDGVQEGPAGVGEASRGPSCRRGGSRPARACAACRAWWETRFSVRSVTHARSQTHSSSVAQRRGDGQPGGVRQRLRLRRGQLDRGEIDALARRRSARGRAQQIATIMATYSF